VRGSGCIVPSSVLRILANPPTQRGDMRRNETAEKLTRVHERGGSNRHEEISGCDRLGVPVVVFNDIVLEISVRGTGE